MRNKQDLILSCGTCMNCLREYQFGKIFPGCLLPDVASSLEWANSRTGLQGFDPNAEPETRTLSGMALNTRVSTHQHGQVADDG